MRNRAFKDARKQSAIIQNSAAVRRSGRARIVADAHERLSMTTRRIIDCLGDGRPVSLDDLALLKSEAESLIVYVFSLAEKKN